MKSAVVITGGTSGIGKALALTYSSHGHRVYTLSRRAHKWKKDGITHIICDVSRESDLHKALSVIAAREKSISHLICAAGYGIAGATEYTTLEEAKRQFDVNFFGLFSTIKMFLPLLKKNKNGKIVFLSSVASEISIPFQSFYCSSKVAGNKLLEAWQLELKKFGIKTTIFLLGDIKTDFTANRKKTLKKQYGYQEVYERSVSRMEQDEQNGLSSKYVAKTIYLRCKRKGLAPLQTIGAQYHLFLILQRLLPRSVILFLVEKLYAS